MHPSIVFAFLTHSLPPLSLDANAVRCIRRFSQTVRRMKRIRNDGNRNKEEADNESVDEDKANGDEDGEGDAAGPWNKLSSESRPPPTQVEGSTREC